MQAESLFGSIRWQQKERNANAKAKADYLMSI
jgi:hypothetical protein